MGVDYPDLLPSDQKKDSDDQKRVYFSLSTQVDHLGAGFPDLSCQGAFTVNVTHHQAEPGLVQLSRHADQQILRPRRFQGGDEMQKTHSLHDCPTGPVKTRLVHGLAIDREPEMVTLFIDAAISMHYLEFSALSWFRVLARSPVSLFRSKFLM
jgi:hypothetical protein